jgi:signal transduction histidine kinase
MGQDDPARGVTDRGYERRLLAAWERFVDGAGLPSGVVRDVVGQSWIRCRSAHLDPALEHAPDPLAEPELMALRQRHRELIEASRPVMTQAHDLLSESATMMILTDPTGVILQSEGDAATLEAGLDIRLTVGANWNELMSGTNAIGTALSVGGPVRVQGAEHFCAGIKPWSCSATAVRDPASGELLGVVDISGLRKSFNHHWLALAVSSATHIEERLSSLDSGLRQRLLEWGVGNLSRTADGGLLFYDRRGRLTAADARARASLAAMGLDLDLDAHAAIEAFRADSAIDLSEATLPHWLRPDWIEPAVVRGERLGVVVVLPRPPKGTVQSGPAPADFAIASVAHEVKQPLAAIELYAGASLTWLARQQPNLAQARQGLEQIIQAVKRAGDVVSRVRELFKKIAPQKDLLDLNEIILGVVALMRSQAEEQHVALDARLSQHLPAVLADRIQVQEVILNLVKNALESLIGCEGYREVSIGSRALQGSEVVVDVKDTGKGLDAETAEHMFEPFYTTKSGGMGIGLAISRSIIEAHGGKLWAMKNSPRGATFLFSLPASDG